jgi:GNAT superfamily N-acetyltransferase
LKDVAAFTIRAGVRGDAAALADLLNEIIIAGGTTAYQIPFTPEGFANAHIDGPAVLTCMVAHDENDAPMGFQILLRDERLPQAWGDIGTFARRGATTRGIGTALFAATCDAARQLGLIGINATIRADNSGGLAFYGKQGFRDHAVASAVPLNDGTRVDRISKRYSLV